VTVLRPSIVLDPAAPVTQRLAGLARWGVGGTVGSGRQWVSWLHIEDFERIIEWCLPGSMPGVVLATSPEPVQNAEFMRELRRAMGHRLGLPTPTFLVKLGAPLLGTDASLALSGRRAIPRRLLDAGFRFEHPRLHEAVSDLFRSPPPTA
jgi:NAD dependent epimerase/dehydratase family enzyme